MNLLNRYLRSLCETGRGPENRKTGRRRHRMSWYEYWQMLLAKNGKLIAKHSKTVHLEEIYSTTCAKKLPLSQSCKTRLESNCRKCVHFEPPTKNYRRWQADSKTFDATEVALQCWITVLEDPKGNFDTSGDVPGFLKKKELPSFLKKK